MRIFFYDSWCGVYLNLKNNFVYKRNYKKLLFMIVACVLRVLVSHLAQNILPYNRCPIEYEVFFCSYFQQFKLFVKINFQFYSQKLDSNYTVNKISSIVFSFRMMTINCTFPRHVVEYFFLPNRFKSINKIIELNWHAA